MQKSNRISTKPKIISFFIFSFVQFTSFSCFIVEREKIISMCFQFNSKQNNNKLLLVLNILLDNIQLKLIGYVLALAIDKLFH